MLRTILGVVAGLVVMLVAITGIEFLGNALYPPPPGLDPMVPADLERIIAGQLSGAGNSGTHRITDGVMRDGGSELSLLVVKHDRTSSLNVGKSAVSPTVMWGRSETLMPWAASHQEEAHISDPLT